MEDSNNKLGQPQQISLHPKVAQALGGLYFENFLLKNDLAGIKQEVSEIKSKLLDKKTK